MKKYLIDGHHVVIRSIPSCEEQQKLAQSEADRLELQKKRLGPDGLAKQAEILKEAIEANKTEPPIEKLSLMSIPNADQIDLVPSTVIERGATSSECKNIQMDLFPVHVIACDIASEMCTVSKKKIIFFALY